MSIYIAEMFGDEWHASIAGIHGYMFYNAYSLEKLINSLSYYDISSYRIFYYRISVTEILLHITLNMKKCDTAFSHDILTSRPNLRPNS